MQFKIVINMVEHPEQSCGQMVAQIFAFRLVEHIINFVKEHAGEQSQLIFGSLSQEAVDSVSHQVEKVAVIGEVAAAGVIEFINYLVFPEQVHRIILMDGMKSVPVDFAVFRHIGYQVDTSEDVRGFGGGHIGYAVVPRGEKDFSRRDIKDLIIDLYFAVTGQTESDIAALHLGIVVILTGAEFPVQSLNNDGIFPVFADICHKNSPCSAVYNNVKNTIFQIPDILR